jgi:hypothetical protein
MLESEYQAWLIQEIRKRLPGAHVLKNDSDYQQGIPDLTVLYGDRWAVLEVKRSERARSQPNQEWFINEFDAMSFAAFIYPENEEQVLRDLQLSLTSRRRTRVS